MFLLQTNFHNFTSYNGVYLQGTLNNTTTPALSMTRMKHTMNMKAYEQSNHLGNVVVTVSDARQVLNSGASVTGYMAIVKSASDYSSFGVTKAGRTYTSTSYRYSFNGKEKENEIASGDLDFGARIYDARLGRWLSVDPLYAKYPHISPYAFVDNIPLISIDADGRDIIVLCSEALASDPESKHIPGHQAVLIGNDVDGWTFYSYDNDEGKYDSKENDNFTSGIKFATLNDFTNSEYNTYKDDYDDGKGKETSHKDSEGKIIQRFTQGYRISTDVATDKKMQSAAEKTFLDPYNAYLGNECTAVVKNALEAGGLKTGEYKGNGNKYSVTGIPNEKNRFPEQKQETIEQRNKGIDIDDLLVPEWLKTRPATGNVPKPDVNPRPDATGTGQGSGNGGI